MPPESGTTADASESATFTVGVANPPEDGGESSPDDKSPLPLFGLQETVEEDVLPPALNSPLGPGEQGGTQVDGLERSPASQGNAAATGADVSAMPQPSAPPSQATLHAAATVINAEEMELSLWAASLRILEPAAAVLGNGTARVGPALTRRASQLPDGFQSPTSSGAATFGSNATAASSMRGGSRAGSIYSPDDQSPGIRVSGPASLTEGGTGGTFGVVLKAEPTSAVPVEISVGSGLTASATGLMFTPSNWSIPQTITVSATANSTAEGYHGAVITTATGTSSDPAYDSINGDTFWVGILDANGPNAVTDSAYVDAGPNVVTLDVLANDYEPGGWALDVVNHTQGDSGGTVTLNSDQTVSYEPPLDFFGLDHFTYTIDNGQGQSATGDVYVYIDPVNHTPAVAPIPARTNAEDDPVSLFVVGSDEDKEQLFYSATNLPPGLTIDRLTGEIWGTVAAYAANPNPYQPVQPSHTYAVTVEVADSQGATTSTSFDWTITHTNHAPWLEKPAYVIAPVMSSLNRQVIAHDADIRQGMIIDQLTYSASGLPPGISINPQTGVIFGTLMPAAQGFFQPTVSVTDGMAVASQSFGMRVVSYGTQYSPVSIWLNDTADTGDDLTEDGAPVSATIVGQPGKQAWLSVSGPATLGATSVTIGADGTAQVWVFPSALSQSVGDIVISAEVLAQNPFLGGDPVPEKVDEKALTNIKITFPDIDSIVEKYNDLPADSKNHTVSRIGYRLTTFRDVTLSLDLSKSTHKVKLEPVQKDANGGEFQFENDKQQKVNALEIQKNAFVGLYGKTMTQAGKHGKLVIKATIGKVEKESAAFSVSAWPTKLRLKDMGRNTTGKEVTIQIKDRKGVRHDFKVAPYSAYVTYYWDSDSGDIADLDQVWIGEFAIQVEAINSPPWKVDKNIPANESYVLPDRGTLVGKQGFFHDLLRVWGDDLPTKQADTVKIKQWFGFRDGRAESSDPKDASHDYQNDIAYWVQERKVFQDNTDMKWYYEMTRKDLVNEAEPADGLRIEIP